MFSDNLILFAAVAAAVIVTPGPDTALTIRSSLAGSRQAGVMTAAGVASGQLAWALATSLGVTALLAASDVLFRILSYAGAAYLAWIGVQALRSAFRSRRSSDPQPISRGHLARPAAYRHGLLSNLSNPKMLFFFVSLLPQFMTPGADPFASYLALGLVFAMMTAAWLTVVATLTARAGAAFRSSTLSRLVEGIMGAILVGFAVRLAVQR